MADDLPEAPPTTGLIAGKYEIVRLIGRGGMGTVWEGRHASLGNHVAIKFIDSEYADSQEARTRFDNEARAAANIQSKHAIQIFDHGVTHDGKPYIVMELLHGEPLDGRLDRLGRLPLPETARILRQVARALARAHERGIVHRDLKPENIFLVRTPDDDDEVAKVLDFGIAKFKRMDGGAMGSGAPTSSTKTGAVLGTPFYMAPEQARGLREIDHRCDLWSMGVIAYKCVVGVLPFEGVSVGDLLVKICTAPAPVPSALVPGLGAAFDAWFLRALDKEPARRFQSAAELADALAYCAGLSVKRPGSMAPSSDEPFTAQAASAPPVRSGTTQPEVRAASGESATSAPFTSPSPGAGSSKRGPLVFGGSMAVGVVATMGYFLLHQPPRSTSSGVVQNATSEIAVAAAPPSVAPPVALTPAATTTDAGASTPLDVAVQPQDKSGSAHHGRPPKGGGAPRPPAAVATASPTGVAGTIPTAPLPSPTTPTSQPKPAPTTKASASSMDPGY